MNHLAKLKTLRGKQHIYKQATVVIDDYEIDEEGLHLKATRDGKPTELMVPGSDVEQFFKDLLPVEAPASVDDVVLYKSQQESLGSMRAQLMELNTKLSGPDGEKYIKQAKAVSNNINTILNSLKLEFQITKEMKKQQ